MHECYWHMLNSLFHLNSLFRLLNEKMNGYWCFFRCESPSDLKGKDVYKAVSVLSCGFGRSSVALGLGIPILIVCLCVISYYVYRIAKSHHYKKRLRSSVKYSSVYGDTVESSSKQSIL